MAYKSLLEFISVLERNNELVRIQEFVDPVFEIAEITDRESKKVGGGKALLFENTGTLFPVLTNSMGSYTRISLALNTNRIDELGVEIDTLIRKITKPANSLFDKLRMLPMLSEISSWIPTSKSGRGDCQQVITTNPDLSILPVLKCWPADGGRFITLPMVITRDLYSGIRNVGMYRMQIFDDNSTGMHWHRHKVGARHFQQYKEKGLRMPVSIALGGDPAYTYSATAPMPDNMDEFMLAGFIRKKKVQLVKSITNDIEVPADCDFVIEGYVDPSDELTWEGPFGDHTGFYSLADWYPKLHVTCITHKKNAVFPATIVGVPPQEDAYIAIATERIFLPLIRFSMLPELVDMNIPPQGVAHNLTLVSIDKTFPGQAQKVMNSLWGAGQMMFNKVLCVFDKDVDLNNYHELFKTAILRFNPSTDIFISSGPLDVLDHASNSFAYGSKVCFDFTSTLAEEGRKATYDIPFSKNDVFKIEDNYSSVTNIDCSFIDQGLSFVILSVDKSKCESVKFLVNEINNASYVKGVKIIVIVDSEFNVEDKSSLSWLIFSNIDPKRDFIFMENEGAIQIFVDATFKTSTKDNFKRDWPNVVTSSLKTIKDIDEKYLELGFEDMAFSPSLAFKSIVRNDSAIASD